VVPGSKKKKTYIHINTVKKQQKNINIYGKTINRSTAINHFYVIGHESYWIRWNNGHYAIQGYRFWYQSKAHIRLPISD